MRKYICAICALHLCVCRHIIIVTGTPTHRIQEAKSHVHTYDVTYEMQSGERRTCIVTHYNLAKAAQQAERLLPEYDPNYKMLVEVKEHIYD